MHHLPPVTLRSGCFAPEYDPVCPDVKKFTPDGMLAFCEEHGDVASMHHPFQVKFPTRVGYQPQKLRLHMQSQSFCGYSRFTSIPTKVGCDLCCVATYQLEVDYF